MGREGGRKDEGQCTLVLDGGEGKTAITWNTAVCSHTAKVVQCKTLLYINLLLGAIHK